MWPYELNELDVISDVFEATGKADAWLSEDADGGRGYGGVGMLWHRSLRASPMSGIIEWLSTQCASYSRLYEEGEGEISQRDRPYITINP